MNFNLLAGMYQSHLTNFLTAIEYFNVIFLLVLLPPHPTRGRDVTVPAAALAQIQLHHVWLSWW